MHSPFSGSRVYNINNKGREIALTQMPEFTSCNRDPFLSAFQLLQVLILWQPEPFLNYVGLWLEHHQATLSVSKQPADVYSSSQWAPWDGKAGLSVREPPEECLTFPTWKWQSLELSQRGCRGSVGWAECKTPGCMVPDSLHPLKFGDFQMPSGSGLLGCPLSAPYDLSLLPFPSCLRQVLSLQAAKTHSWSQSCEESAVTGAVAISPVCDIWALCMGSWSKGLKFKLMQIPDRENQACTAIIPRRWCLSGTRSPGSLEDLSPDSQSPDTWLLLSRSVHLGRSAAGPALCQVTEASQTRAPPWLCNASFLTAPSILQPISP